MLFNFVPPQVILVGSFPLQKFFYNISNQEYQKNHSLWHMYWWIQLGGARDAHHRVQFLAFSCSFGHMLTPSPWELTSSIWEILDPPLTSFGIERVKYMSSCSYHSWLPDSFFSQYGSSVYDVTLSLRITTITYRQVCVKNINYIIPARSSYWLSVFEKYWWNGYNLIHRMSSPEKTCQ